jgi:hypothetical protein
MTKQLEIPGAEDPARNDEVDAALYAWLDAKEERRKSTDATKIKHASLIERLTALGIERYGYLDAYTGRKKFVVVKRDAKATTTRAPSPPKPKKERAPKAKPEEQVEHRKVSRASVEAEVDPFAQVRSKMEH